MYGTVARLSVKPGHVGGLELILTGRSMPVGAVSVNAYRADTNPNEVWLTVVFESKEAYLANAESAEQNQRYNEMMTYLENAPEWHDGEVFHSMTN